MGTRKTWKSWTPIEDELSADVDLLAAVDWIARHRVTYRAEDRWEAAKLLLKYALQDDSVKLVAEGRSTVDNSRGPIPSMFWIDAIIDDFHNNAFDIAFDKTVKFIYIDGVREPMRGDSGYKHVYLKKSAVLKLWPKTRRKKRVPKPSAA